MRALAFRRSKRFKCLLLLKPISLKYFSILAFSEMYICLFKIILEVLIPKLKKAFLTSFRSQIA